MILALLTGAAISLGLFSLTSGQTFASDPSGCVAVCP